jgi:hypothetical protein
LARVFIVYRTSDRSKKYLAQIFEDIHVDDILSTTKRQPLAPYEWELEVVAIDPSDKAILKYKKQYDIK